MAADEGALIDYRAGAESDRYGWFRLLLSADGEARLQHHGNGLARRWRARVEPALWPRLLDALRRGDFPVPPPEGPPGAPPRYLTVTGVEPEGELRIHWDDTGALAPAFALLDAVVHQIGAGQVRGLRDTLPWVVRRVTIVPADDDTAPVPMPAASFGELGARPVGGVIGVDGGVTILTVPEGGPVAELAPTGSPPRAVTFTEIDGDDVVVTGGDDGLLRIWAADGRQRSSQHRHAGPVSALASTRDEGPITLWSADRTGLAFQRGVEPGAPVDELTLAGAPGGVTALHWAGIWLVTGTEDGTVGLQQIDRPANARVFPPDLPADAGWVNAVAVIGVDDDLLIASGGSDRVIRVRRGIAGDDLPELAGHDDSVVGLVFQPDGERLLLGSCAFDGTVRVWDVEAGAELTRWPARTDWPAGPADVTAGGVPRMATGGNDGVVRIWDTLTGVELLTLVPDTASAVVAVGSALLPGRTLVAAGYQDGTFRVWDAVDGTALGADHSSQHAITSVTFGHEDDLDGFFCGTAAGAVRLHDPDTARFWRDFTPHTDQILAVVAGEVDEAELPVPMGGRILVSAGADRALRVWNARTGWPLHTLLGHADLVAACAVGAVDGRPVIASAGYDRSVRLWDATTGRALRVLWGPISPVYCLAFGALDGRALVAAAGHGDAVRVWDAATGELLVTSKPVGGFVGALIMGSWRGGEAVIAAGEDDVWCWALPGGELIATAPVAVEPLALRLAPTGELWALNRQGLTTIDLSPTR